MTEQATQMESGAGFIAALDQSGGSTPKALGLYGVDAGEFNSEEEMFAEIQRMRARIILAPDFNSAKVIGAILFERTMNEVIEGKPVPHYLWEDCGVVPFLKIDKGLEDEANGVQLMKPIAGLTETLAGAKAAGIFGTKERSVIQSANRAGIEAVVAQQFALGSEVLAAGLVPIIEPEVNIHASDKGEIEAILHEVLEHHVAQVPAGSKVMLKLTIPTVVGLYDDLAEHANVMRVVALSGGYSTDVACEKLSTNTKMIASFSRALTEGLQRDMSDTEFDVALGRNIDKIYRASI